MLIDTHSHLNLYLQFKRFGKTIEPALKEIEKNKIFTITNSMDVTSYRINKQIAKKSKYIVPAFGIHPWNAPRYIDKIGLVKELIDESQIIGEIGLDYFFVKDRGRHSMQRRLFSVFLAKTRDKVISVHTKGAEEDTLRLLKIHGNKKVIMHWYSGNINTLRRMIKEGFYFSVTPEIGYSEQARRVAEIIPLQQILTETDNPGGPPQYNGTKAGTPILVKEVVDSIAKIKGMSSKRIEQQIEENLKRLSGGLFPSAQLNMNKKEK